MASLTQPSLEPEQRESHLIPILLGIILVIIVVGLVAFLGREKPKAQSSLHPYAANVRLTDLKMSAAENFVGANVTYLDGTVTNDGEKTVTRAMVHIVFNDAVGQTAQVEDQPIRVVTTVGPYADAVDLSTAPLAPGQSKPFRITLEHVSSAWDREYPAMQVTDVTLK
jgi:hypothetical protein